MGRRIKVLDISVVDIIVYVLIFYGCVDRDTIKVGTGVVFK